jgi:hypothetical protein
VLCVTSYFNFLAKGYSLLPRDDHTILRVLAIQPSP